MASLQEQLLKAGLADEKSAKKIRKQKKKNNKAIRKGQLDADFSLQNEIKIKKVAQVKTDSELNQVIQNKMSLKSAHASIKQMIIQLSIKDFNGEIDFNYVLNTTIKKLSVNQSIYNALTKGQVGLCIIAEKIYIMPATIIEKINTVDSKYIVLLNENKTKDLDEDDLYADYQIPDDLIW